MRKNIAGRLLSGLVHVFYPEVCEYCGCELGGDESVLCLSCTFQLPRTGYHHLPDNKSTLVFSGRIPIVRATSFVYFTKQGIMQQLLHRFKYRNRPGIGRYLGALLGDELKKSEWMDTIDHIIPVPLHKRKELQRGYNQAGIFAGGIAGTAGVPVLPNVLKRTRNTESQTHKTRAERVENVRDVFRTLRPELLQDKHLLLVDDVLTTGATLESGASELLKIPGVRISIATIALATD